MTLTEWRKTAVQGDCENCGNQGLVALYRRTNPYSGGNHPMRLCFICASVPGINAVEYPEQHPNHHIIRPIIGAMSKLLDELKPPKKPRQPKTEGPSVHPMRPRRK